MWISIIGSAQAYFFAGANVTLLTSPYNSTVPSITTITSVFGSSIALGGVAGPIIYVPDGGCEPYSLNLPSNSSLDMSTLTPILDRSSQLEGIPNPQFAYIGLIERGNCPFDQKVYNGELAGLNVVIIMNNGTDVDPDVLVRMSPTSGGPLVNIPSFFMSLKSGSKIKQYIETVYSSGSGGSGSSYLLAEIDPLPISDYPGSPDYPWQDESDYFWANVVTLSILVVFTGVILFLLGIVFSSIQRLIRSRRLIGARMSGTTLTGWAIKTTGIPLVRIELPLIKVTNEILNGMKERGVECCAICIDEVYFII